MFGCTLKLFLAGIPVDDKRVLTLAAKLRDAGLDDTAERLETAYDRETAVLALAIPHATTSSRCSSTAPKDSASSAPCLLKQQAWRDREGIR